MVLTNLSQLSFSSLSSVSFLQVSHICCINCRVAIKVSYLSVPLNSLNSTVSLYNKYAQMKEQEKDFPDIKDAKNIVRIEIRCMKDKLEQIRKRKKFEALKLDDKVKGYMKHSDAIAEYLYHYYLEKMFGKGAFYTLPEARERIENSGFSKVNKNNMTEFIEYANTARSFNDAVCFYIECCGKSYVKNLLYFFDLIDTSPVTVTRDIAKSFDGQYIPHPIDLLDDFNN